MKDQDNSIIEVGAIFAISRKFAPARDIADSTHRWTTSEIAIAIQNHSGITVPIDQLHELLLEEGFKYEIDDTVINVKFVWLLKSK